MNILLYYLIFCLFQSTSYRKKAGNRYAALKDSALLTLGDYERIKRTITSTEEEYKAIQTQSRIGTNKEKALALKAKIIDYDNKNKYMGLTEFDKNLQPSKVKEDDLCFTDQNRQNDKMKEMSQLATFAKIAHIRDKQLAERKYMEDLYFRRNTALDKMMEVERLKELKFQQEREKQRKAMQREGSLYIVDQIKEREIERRKISGPEFEKIKKETVNKISI